MKYRVLGKTGLRVSEIGFGAWAIGGNAFGNSYGPTDDNVSLQALKTALDNGCNFIDTADIYGHGHSEELIGKVVQGNIREQIIIATKVGGDFYSGKIRMNFSPEYIREAVDKSLERLNTDYIDLYQLHNPTLAMIKEGSIFEVMRQLKISGKIRYFGIAIDDAIEGIEAMQWEGVDTIQVVYNLFDQEPAEELFSRAKSSNTGIIAREPLANGLLTGKYNESSYFPFGDIRHAWPVSFISNRTRATRNLRPLLKDEINSRVKLSLKFVLASKAVSTVIPGCKDVEQTLENFSAGDLRDLTTEELEQIEILYKRRFNV